jgi:uncharacterized BrkB/YihY/UPF0761 family membrane protein
MTESELVIPPPSAPQYPIIIGLCIGAALTVILIFVISRFDRTGGALAISLMIILGFLAIAAFSVYYTIPQDPSTSAIIGALVSSVGAIIAYWLGKPPDKPPGNM